MNLSQNNSSYGLNKNILFKGQKLKREKSQSENIEEKHNNSDNNSHYENEKNSEDISENEDFNQEKNNCRVNFYKKKTFVCLFQNCGKSFGERFNLNLHIKLKHIENKIYKCSYCIKEFLHEICIKIFFYFLAKISHEKKKHKKY